MLPAGPRSNVIGRHSPWLTGMSYANCDSSADHDCPTIAGHAPLMKESVCLSPRYWIVM